MSATAPENRVAAADRQDAPARVEAYLRAWRIGDVTWSRDCADEIVRAAEQKATSGGSNFLSAAIAEADLFLARWFQQFGNAEQAESGETVPIEQRAAVLFGAPADANWNLSDRTQLLAAMRQGSLNFASALRPARPPETRAFTMQTSLSRLPSIQLIAGWMVLIAVLFLAFVLTHHRI